MSASPAPIWVVAGAPGAGKTTAARVFARTVHPPAALLDKDTVYGGFVAAALEAAGRPIGEREGPWYDVNIKVHEYAGLVATAREIRQSGCAAVLCAPYSGHIRDVSMWQQLVHDAGGPDVHLIWVRCDPHVLRTRITSRGSPRDRNKLLDYEQFIVAVTPDVPPAVPHYTIDNSHGGLEELSFLAKRAAVSFL